MLPDQVDASATKESLKIMDQIITIFALKLPYYMTSSLMKTFFNFMRATKVTPDTGLGIILLFSYRCYSAGKVTCVNNKFPSVRDDNKNMFYISLAVIHELNL